jgi:hypothetical protein
MDLGVDIEGSALVELSLADQSSAACSSAFPSLLPAMIALPSAIGCQCYFTMLAQQSVS